MNLTRFQHIVRLLNNRYKRFGGAKYVINEPTTILNHSVQTAQYIQFKIGGTSEIVVSALLHDYGHIAHGKPIAPEKGIDDKHEQVGAEALKDLGFPDSVTIPISLHVKAKRYLATVDSRYKLSEGSLLSLKLQGGKMNSDELLSFEQNPYYSDALTLRIADDQAKSVRVSNKDIISYQNYIIDVLRSMNK